MNNKLLIGIAVFLIVLLGLILFLSSSDKKISGAVISDSAIQETSEEVRLAKFSAEYACNALRNPSKDPSELLSDFEKYAKKYDFNTEEITDLQFEYSRDTDYQKLLLEEMENFCPEYLSK